MTNDEQNTARELIESALSDSVTEINSPHELAKLIANGLRDDEHHRQRLEKIEPHAMLLRVAVHELGKLENQPKHHLGALELEALATCPHSTPTILAHLANTENTYGYALAMRAKPDDQPHAAIILLLATRDGLQLAAIALDDNDKSTDAYLIRNGKNENDHDLPPDMAATLEQLAAAIQRTGAQ